MWKKFLSVVSLIAVLVAMAIGGIFGKTIGHSVSEAIIDSKKPTQQQIEVEVIKGLREAAQESNRNSPQMIDKDTRLDSTMVGPGLRATYFYTFPSYSSHDITASLLDKRLKSIVKNGVCTSQDMKPSLQYGVTYVYIYRGNDGVEISRFSFNRHDCNLPSAF